MEDKAVLEVSGLRYAYSRRLALFDVSFSVRERSIHGFVGPNGAGKTTTLKILATLLRPQGGTVKVMGEDATADYRSIRRRVGFMPEHFSMYRQMTVFEYLDFFAAAYGLRLKERDKVVSEVLALTDMAGRRDEPIKSLSRGMQQRVSLARVLVHDPAVLLLDEPASGLDPRGRIELMEILRELRRMGKTVFISSHILADLTALCDSITVIDGGVTRYSGPIGDLLCARGDVAEYQLTLHEEHPPTVEALTALAGVTGVRKLDDGPDYVVDFRRDALTVNQLLRTVLESGAEVVGFKENLKDLGEAFMGLTRPGVGE